MIISSSAEESFSLGKNFGQTLKESDIICFSGDLGAGKTTFIKGLVEGAIGYAAEQVSSPTFVLLNIYTQNTIKEKTVYHFDLYRLKQADDFFEMGFEEFLTKKAIVCIEWSEKITKFLKSSYYQITIKPLENSQREIQIIKHLL